MLTLSDIDYLRRGVNNPIVVGELDEEIRRILNLRVPLVHLSRDSLRHINKRHSDICDYQLLHLPMVISKGKILRERDKPNTIIALRPDLASYRVYGAIMKVVERDCEIWLQSFYRVKHKQQGRWERRCSLLKRGK